MDRDKDLNIERALFKNSSGNDLFGFSRNFLHSLAGKLSFFSTYNSKLPTLQGLFVTYAVRCFSCREKCTCTSENFWSRINSIGKTKHKYLCQTEQHIRLVAEFERGCRRSPDNSSLCKERQKGRTIYNKLSKITMINWNLVKFLSISYGKNASSNVALTIEISLLISPLRF